MANLDELKRALVNADRAGDVEAARRLAAAIRSQVNAPKEPAKVEKYDPTEGMSTTEKVLAGIGKAMTDSARGVGQLVGLVDKKDIEEAKKLDEALMNTGAGTAGNIIGNIATLAPTALVPGVNTVRGAALINGLAGAALTPGSVEDRALAATYGAGGGAAGVGAAKLLGGTAKAASAAAAPLTQKGQEKIIGDVMRRAAGENVDDVIARMRGARELVPGSVPTAAEVAESGGVAALQRAMAAANPEAYTHRGMSNNAARIEALRGIAKDSTAKAEQQKIVDEAAKKLYGEAFKESVPVTDELVRLASRPSMRMAEQRATKLADELSIPFRATLDEMRPKYVPVGGKQFNASVVESLPNPDFNAYTRFHLPQTVDVEKTLSAGKSPIQYMEVPPVESVPVRDLHTVKMGMDALLSDPTLGIAGREANAIAATRSKLLDSLPDSYQAARQSHIELNKPIHQMDIASELLKKVEPALVEYHPSGVHFRQAGGAYTNALRNGDDVAKKVTGLKNATMQDIMTPQQMQTLNSIGEDLSRSAAAADMGRGVGSNTFQNFAMDNLAAQSGMPSAVSMVANLVPGLGTVGNLAKATGNMIYKSKDELMKSRMADLLLNPQAAADVMENAAKPGRLSQALNNAIGPQNVDKLIQYGSSAPGIFGASFALPYGSQ